MYIQAIDEEFVLVVNEVEYLDQMIYMNIRKNQEKVFLILLNENHYDHLVQFQ